MSIVIGFKITDTGEKTADGMADIQIQNTIVDMDGTSREWAICEAFKAALRKHAPAIIEESLRDGDRSIIFRSKNP